MNITINEELRKYIDPLTDSERASLERSILAEGCRDALVLWGEVLIDGHNRYEICQKHGLEFKTVQNDSFETVEQVMLWMIDNQLSRRSVTDFQRGMLALRKKELLTIGSQAPQVSTTETAPEQTPAHASAKTPAAPTMTPRTSRKEVAQIAGVSSHTIGQIEKIQKTATPALIDAVRVGTISIGTAAAVASLSSDDQLEAIAGGKKELLQAARQVRDTKSSTRAPRTALVDETTDTSAVTGDVTALKAKIAELTAENHALKEQVSMLNLALEDFKRAA
ncbi:MAG TPA: hypothetical protein VNW52_03485 [Burkholderiaceae bacterium]|jgi:hypothetical protein|nr:hypothetical protein [Burkholderiaceae bacterium]